MRERRESIFPSSLECAKQGAKLEMKYSHKEVWEGKRRRDDIGEENTKRDKAKERKKERESSMELPTERNSDRFHRGLT